MAEDNVISLRNVRQKQIDASRDELEIVKSFTRKPLKPKAVVEIVKRQLKARGISYRVSLSSCELHGFDKKAVLIFPESKLIFEFVSKSATGKKIEGWIVEQCICSGKEQPVDYVELIINKLLESKQNGQATAKTQPTD